MADAILALNAGSSSIKFSLFEVPMFGRLNLSSHGEVDGVGSAPHFIVRDPSGSILAEKELA